MENDYLEESEDQIDDEDQIENENTKNFIVQKQLRSTRASKRPIQRSKEPFDIEPLEDNNVLSENSKQDSFEIDDPW